MPVAAGMDWLRCHHETSSLPPTRENHVYRRCARSLRAVGPSQLGGSAIADYRPKGFPSDSFENQTSGLLGRVAERPISGEQIRAELEELISQERDKIAARFHRKVPIGVLLPAAEYLRLSATLRLADHEPMNHHHWMNAVGVILEWYGGGQLIDADGFPTGDDIARLVILAAQQHEILNMVDGIDVGVYRAFKAELPGPRRGYRLQHLAHELKPRATGWLSQDIAAQPTDSARWQRQRMS